MNDLDRYVDEHAADYVAMLQRMVRQPSVAAQGLGMSVMAGMVEELLNRIGAEATQYDTRGGFPVVYGETAGRGARTVGFLNQ